MTGGWLFKQPAPSGLTTSRSDGGQIIRTPAETWVWSDLHLGHAAAVGNFRRPFEGVEAMNRHLLGEWRRCVRPDHTIICLGDVADLSLRSDPRLVLDLQAYPGERVLILGNHDLDREDLREAGFTTQYDVAIYDADPPLALSHEPVPTVPRGALNLHGHLHGEGSRPGGT